jgi:hypothetical protein
MLRMSYELLFFLIIQSHTYIHIHTHAIHLIRWWTYWSIIWTTQLSQSTEPDAPSRSSPTEPSDCVRLARPCTWPHPSHQPRATKPFCDLSQLFCYTVQSFFLFSSVILWFSLIILLWCSKFWVILLFCQLFYNFVSHLAIVLSHFIISPVILWFY